MMSLNNPCIVQGSSEWKALRKTKVTATDAAVIMGLNPWKTPLQLYEEKLDLVPEKPRNAAMQRGIDLEEEARACFERMTGTVVFPRVLVRDWQMASLDGIDFEDTCLVEIKVPAKKTHEMAKRNVIPAYYRCQVMYQIHLTNLDHGNYFSYRPHPMIESSDFEGLVKSPFEDWEEGIIIPVERNEEFIKDMVQACWQFYECLVNKVPPTELVLI